MMQEAKVPFLDMLKTMFERKMMRSLKLHWKRADELKVVWLISSMLFPAERDMSLVDCRALDSNRFFNEGATNKPGLGLVVVKNVLLKFLDDTGVLTES